MSGKMESSLWRPLQIAILIQVLISTVQQATGGNVCWTNFPDSFRRGGNKTYAADLACCQSACLQSSDCGSIDFDPTSKECWLHTKDNIETKTGIQHYELGCSGVPVNCSGQNLTNTVVYENTTNASFPILANGQAVQWTVLSASEFYNQQRVITYPNGTMNPQFANTYTVTPSQLGIINATVAPRQPSMPCSTAGLYRLDYLNPNCTYAANLIVIRNGPYCSCNGTDPNNVRLICGVDYAQSSVQPNNPVFTWSAGTNTVKTSQPMPSQISTYIKRSSSTYTVYANDPTTYTCRLTFNVTASSPYNFVTSTAPTFTKSCQVFSCAVV